eukprot:SAG31_NODE_3278_length_4472_cov_1.683512_1_plen_154_part_00
MAKVQLEHEAEQTTGDHRELQAAVSLLHSKATEWMQLASRRKDIEDILAPAGCAVAPHHRLRFFPVVIGSRLLLTRFGCGGSPMPSGLQVKESCYWVAALICSAEPQHSSLRAAVLAARSSEEMLTITLDGVEVNACAALYAKGHVFARKKCL